MFGVGLSAFWTQLLPSTYKTCSMPCRLFKQELTIEIKLLAKSVGQRLSIVNTTWTSVDNYAILDCSKVAAKRDVTWPNFNTDAGCFERSTSCVHLIYTHLTLPTKRIV